MPKITTYNNVTTPTLTDRLLGTDVDANNETKNFLIEDVGEVIGLPQIANVTVTPSQLLTSFTTAVTLLDPIGTSYVLAIDSIYWNLEYGTTAYDFSGTLGIGQDLSGLPVTTNQFQLTTTTLNDTSNIYRELERVALTTVGNYALVVNGGLYMKAATGNPTVGDSPFNFRIYYRRLPLGSTWT